MLSRPLNILIIAILTLLTLGCGQVKDVFIISQREKLAFKNAIDSSLIELKYSEDMGRRYGQHYIFKKNIPSGYYKIFINDTVKEKASFKNGQRNGVSKDYPTPDTKSITVWEDGSPKDVRKEYFKNNLYRETFFEDGKIIIRVSYSSNHLVQSIELFIDANLVRIEKYDEKGQLKEVSNKMPKQLLEQPLGYVGKERKGNILYNYKEGTITLEYKANRIVKCHFELNK